MIVECPHCHRKVLPLPDGECPSCRRDVWDSAGVNHSVTEAVVSAEERLPQCCIACGRYTSSVRRLRPRRPKPGPDADRASPLLVLFGPPVLLIHALVVRLLRSRQERMDFSIPCCESCRKAGSEISPHYVNWRSHTVRLLVNRAFREKLRQIRG